MVYRKPLQSSRALVAVEVEEAKRRVFLCFLLRRWRVIAKYIAIAKTKSAVPGDIRPFGITSAPRRIFGKYVMIESGKLIGEEKSNPNLRWAFHPARDCPERRY
jgi:hypothetical protein